MLSNFKNYCFNNYWAKHNYEIYCLLASIETLFGDGIKGLILRRCGKLKSTHPGKLPPPQIVHYGCLNALAAMHEMNIPSHAKFESSVAAMHEPQCTRGTFHLVHCGVLCIVVATFKFLAAAMHEQSTR